MNKYSIDIMLNILFIKFFNRFVNDFIASDPFESLTINEWAFNFLIIVAY